MVLDLIAQADLRMKDLELWRDNIHADACLLLAPIRQERLDNALKVEHLDQELKILTEKSIEAERVAGLALAERENALILSQMAHARAIEAESKADLLEKRALIAEEWLYKLQAILAEEFQDRTR